MIAVIAAPMLGGCYGKGSSAAPPSGITVVAGDGRVEITWTPDTGVDYWIFAATDPSLTAFNWASLDNGFAKADASTPAYLCGLYVGDQYYFAMNGRTNGGPGGASSPTYPATPYNASANSWTALAPFAKNVYGLGYTSLATCANNATSASGGFVAVGAGGAIYNSTDGISWIAAASAPPGPDLYAVAGNATNLNNTASPPVQIWAAVGDGVAVYSYDGNYWNSGNLAAGTPPLRSLTHSGNAFCAVGDGGTMASSADGINWTTLSSITTNNLHGIAHGGIYVAVGDSGTILTSANCASWGQHYPSGISTLGNNLRQVAAAGSLIVAVGDAGTIVTSKDGGATWYTQTLAGTPNLVGVAAESQTVGTDKANNVVDGWLGIVPTVQFVAIDSSGQTYTTASNPASTASTNGLTWSPAYNTAISCSTATACLNPLISSGFGYVYAGDAGAGAYAF